MFLERVNDPADIKTLTLPELEVLSKEIRDFLVQSITSTGGHFGANLGVVELTVALHYVFDSPIDRIIWDVGHQAYVHKILTGRKQQFSTLRKFHGLAGFPKRSESPHDFFGVGHASTSISAALGMAIARDLHKQSHHIVAVIGDGAMTGGIAFEALNHAGHLKKRLLVILNDNAMSISPNVGAVSHYLTRLRTDPYYGKFKGELETLLKRIPAFGSKLATTAERLRDTLKYAMVPGVLFEEMGFSYFGPVPGHDMGQVIQLLRQAKDMDGPVLLHVVTQKGKGYASAESAPDKLHSIGGTVVKPKSPAPTYTGVFGKTLVDLAKKDERIVAVTAAMLNSGLNEFVSQFPDRCFDVGIAEQHAATLCAGLSTAGMRPVFSVYSTFLQRAYDQVIHDICIQNLPVVFAVDRAGLVGPDGETHQGAFDAAFLRAIPNMTIMMPKDEGELRHMLYTAFTLSGPVAVRFPREDGIGAALDVPYQIIPIGKSQILREGRDIALLALGPMVALAENAALMLAERGISSHVVNMRFVKPIDEEALIELALKNIPMITIEEGTTKGGLGSAVLEYLASQKIPCTVYPVGLPDRFIEHGNRPELLHQVGLTSQHVLEVAVSLVGEKQGQNWSNRKTAGR